MSPTDLVERWRNRARELEPYAAPAAAAFAKAADELEAALAENETAVVSLNDAARTSGYSPDHLGRLIREGKLENVGRKHAPRLRTHDVEQLRTKHPRTRRGLTTPKSEGYDPRADARSLMRRRSGGSDAA